MVKEKTLSDEIFIMDDGYHPKEEVLLASDVKKFIEKLKKNAVRFSVRAYDETIKGDYHKKTKLASWGNTEAEANKIADDYIKEEKLNKKNLTIEIIRNQRDITVEDLNKLSGDALRGN